MACQAVPYMSGYRKGVCWHICIFKIFQVEQCKYQRFNYNMVAISILEKYKQEYLLHQNNLLNFSIFYIPIQREDLEVGQCRCKMLSFFLNLRMQQLHNEASVTGDFGAGLGFKSYKIETLFFLTILKHFAFRRFCSCMNDLNSILSV